jgi:hypothetical protein
MLVFAQGVKNCLRDDLKKKVTEYNMCFDFLYNIRLKHFSFYEELSEIS